VAGPAAVPGLSVLLAWPRGIELRTATGRPWFTAVLLLLAVAVQLVVSVAPSLPPALDGLSAMVAWARLNSDPGQGLFGPWQLWTSVLVHDGWIQLLLAGSAFAILGGGLERRLGSGLFALVLLVLAPLGVAVLVIAGVPGPALGLGPLAAGSAGGLLTLSPRAALRIELAWWLVVVVGRTRRRLGLAWILAIFLGLEIWRLALLPRDGLGAVPADVLPLYVAGLVVVIAAGHLLGHSLAAIHDHSAMAPLSRLATGHGNLDQIEAILAAVEDPPVTQLAAIGERAMREGHRPAALALLAQLTVRAPECGTARRLRSWLSGLDRTG